MKRMKVTLFILLSIIVGIFGIFILVKTDVITIKTNKTSEISLLQDRLVELSEWTTLKYEYSTVIISRTDRSLDVPVINDIHIGETIKLIEYTGYLKAGTDLSKLEISYDEISKQLQVRVPKSQILDNVAETENMKIQDVKGSILSDYPSQTILDEINASKSKLEEEKILQGFLEDADIRILSLLTSFLNSLNYNDIIIEFY